MPFKSPTRPLCRACGKAIPKWTHSHRLSSGADAPLVESIEECQRLSNEKVIAVGYVIRSKPFGFSDRKALAAGYKRTIRTYSTWDGESYKDEFFCKGACAQAYAYMVARSPHNLAESAAYADAVKRRAAPPR